MSVENKDQVKGGENEMEEVIIKKTMFKDTCTVCSKEIIGSTPSQVRWNMAVHMRKHSSQEENDKE